MNIHANGTVFQVVCPRRANRPRPPRRRRLLPPRDPAQRKCTEKPSALTSYILIAPTAVPASIHTGPALASLLAVLRQRSHFHHRCRHGPSGTPVPTA